MSRQYSEPFGYRLYVCNAIVFPIFVFKGTFNTLFDMDEFMYLMDAPQRAFWIIALVASVVFVVQTILSFIGIGDTDADYDVSTADSVDDAGFGGVFSFRNLINFLLGYGWTGVVLYERFESRFMLYFVSILVGLLFVAAFVFMLKQIMKLSHDGTFHPEEAIGLTADVYLRIPAARSGRGKVQFSVKGSVHELDAVTDDGELLPTGGRVRIIEALGDDVVRVTKF